MSVLSRPEFHEEEAAYEYVEARLWPNGPVCPRCGETERVGKLKGKTTRIGVHKCYKCRKPFTVKVRTIFEASHVPMHLWLQAIYLICGSKKGFSANQLHRTLGVTLKTAWFMSHRIREAMRSGDLDPFGGNGGAVEVDETFIGRDRMKKAERVGYQHKHKVLTLVDRDSGRACSIVVDKLRMTVIADILDANVSREAHFMTDEAGWYTTLGWNFAEHGTVNHGRDEYVNPADRTIHTNTIEGFFSVFKRGMRGVYQHCSKRHLQRYMAEYDFRYSNRAALGVNDEERADNLLHGVIGRRLTYAQPVRR
ncbi:IS1595 family transposase [Marinicauda salina]|uniref:IS1595 family transposase n=1 Tax=Marinicauda salina TaxID=2135793 RepID=A0A2U2BX24_9PROT|nr:IS1595 family transposase [Marinicauda salina]PWE18571.1 IS1595 family transposase [Marinicauda salina]